MKHPTYQLTIVIFFTSLISVINVVTCSPDDIQRRNVMPIPPFYISTLPGFNDKDGFKYTENYILTQYTGDSDFHVRFIDVYSDGLCSLAISVFTMDGCFNSDHFEQLEFTNVLDGYTRIEVNSNTNTFLLITRSDKCCISQYRAEIEVISRRQIEWYVQPLSVPPSLFVLKQKLYDNGQRLPSVRDACSYDGNLMLTGYQPASNLRLYGDDCISESSGPTEVDLHIPKAQEECCECVETTTEDEWRRASNCCPCPEITTTTTTAKPITVRPVWTTTSRPAAPVQVVYVYRPKYNVAEQVLVRFVYLMLNHPTMAFGPL